MKSLHERKEVSAIIVRHVVRLLLKRYREVKLPRETKRGHDRMKGVKKKFGTEEQIIL